MQFWQRSDDEDDEDYSFISNKRPQCEAPALKKPLPRNCTKAVTPFANENIKPVGDRESKVETSRFHVIKRSIPLHTFGSEPSHCLNMIDKMYNNYYELEVSIVIYYPKYHSCRHGKFHNLIHKNNRKSLAQSLICHVKAISTKR